MNIDLTGLAAIIGAGILIYKAIKSTPREAVQTEADAVGKYATAAATTAQHNITLQERMTRLENELGVLKNEMAEWAEGIEILTRQLVDANIMPKWTPRK